MRKRLKLETAQARLRYDMLDEIGLSQSLFCPDKLHCPWPTKTRRWFLNRLPLDLIAHAAWNNRSTNDRHHSLIPCRVQRKEHFVRADAFCLRWRARIGYIHP